MSKPVTVDSDDLEALLNAAVFGREAERMLKTLKSDPAMIRLEAKGVIEQAMSRINRARAEAIKPEELKLPVLEDVRLSDSEHNSLRQLNAAGTMGFATTNLPLYMTLCLAGLAVRGQCNEIVRWGDGSDPSAQSMMHARIRITERGRKFLELYP